MHPGPYGYSSFNCRNISYSPARSSAGPSSSEDSLSSDIVASESPPEAPSPKPRCDTEVSSQSVPEQGGHVPGAGHVGAAAPRRVVNGGDLEFGPQPDKVPDTSKALGSGERPYSTEGDLPTPPVAFVHVELPGGLSTALKNASVVEEHRTLMGTVVGKIQSAESGLNESCLGLIKAFEVWLLRNL